MTSKIKKADKIAIVSTEILLVAAPNMTSVYIGETDRLAEIKLSLYIHCLWSSLTLFTDAEHSHQAGPTYFLQYIVFARCPYFHTRKIRESIELSRQTSSRCRLSFLTNLENSDSARMMRSIRDKFKCYSVFVTKSVSPLTSFVSLVPVHSIFPFTPENYPYKYQ